MKAKFSMISCTIWLAVATVSLCGDVMLFFMMQPDVKPDTGVPSENEHINLKVTGSVCEILSVLN